MTFLGRVYRGYAVTPLGSLIGMIWAFVDGLIGGAIFAWLYNLILTCPRCQEPAKPQAAAAEDN